MLKNKNKPITWVFVGDSITHGARHTNGWRSYSEHFAERMRWEMKRYTDTVINTGITNDTIHPNEIGHRAIADEMFRTLGIFDDKSPTCSLPLSK
jgi:lysophospholipase L1-like esterase